MAFFLQARGARASGERGIALTKTAAPPFDSPIATRDALLSCGLVLAGANVPGTDARADDGILTAEEITDLDLTGVGMGRALVV
jgi:hypothetical protein